jgi:hypothetical protein
MGTVVKVEGLREFTKYLRNVGGKTLPKRIRAANLEVATMAAERIASAAPRGKDSDRDSHPGRLAGATKPLATQRVGRVQIGKGLDYARPVIFGWRRHHIEPHPYPFKVMNAFSGDIPRHYNEAVIEALKEA